MKSQALDPLENKDLLVSRVRRSVWGPPCDPSLTIPLGPDLTSHLNRGSQAVMVTLDLKETG